ncbi:DUF6470 family protein [Neobacillus jeddahensis]|uniref:DUF6470 family protein n=1 Tax=Neobacillus jeddahensis TaxID=1461580 RepID=UPI00058F1AED|nr:DUF6470 family protein [Neobacillus jeddahensis]
MQLPQIRLQQTYAQIGLRTTQPNQEIEQQPADLSIQQTPAQMEIDRTPSQLIIDQEQAWGELGFKSIPTLIADEAEFAKNEALMAVAEIAQEGDQLAKIANKRDALMDIVAQKANPEPAKINIAFIPSPGSVKIQFTPTEVHINWKQGGATIDSTQHRPTHNYTPGKTEVYLKQMQSLQIDFIGTNVNQNS